MEPIGLASSVSTLTGIITGAVGCTVLSVLANIVLWRRLSAVQDDQKKEVAEQKKELSKLSEECLEEMKLSREVNAEVKHVLEAILIEMRRSNGVEPSIPSIRIGGGK